MAKKPRVIVADDEKSIRTLLKSRLEREGFDVTVCEDGLQAQKELSSGVETGVVVTDIKMPGMDGFQLTQWAKEHRPLTRVIVITGHGEKEVAVQALRYGACDYLEKPFDMDELTHSVNRAMKEYQTEREYSELMTSMEARLDRVEGKVEDDVWYVSKSSAMSKVNEWIQVLRRESMRGEAEEPTVLIMGESGTGKEGVARMIHAGSRRGKGPWVAVNCANFTEQLLESELFGHEKGSFTGASSLKRGLFEIAKGGTLFLDELGEMDVKLQARLLRVLQEKTFRRVGGTQDIDADVRVVVATNQKLKERISDGGFRDDLYHRISQVVLELPPMRMRKEDLVPMAKFFAERSFRSRGKTFEGFTPDSEAAIEQYEWPGNVREMLNLVERSALVWQGHGPVPGSSLNLPAGRVYPRSNKSSPASVDGASLSPGMQGYMTLKKEWSDAFEKEYLIGALRRSSGNVSAAAREAKLDRSNFLRLLRRHEIVAEDFRKAGDHSSSVDKTGDETSDESRAA